MSQLNQINTHIIRDLENCADSLSDLVDVRVIEKDELVQLISDIDELYRNINSSNINRELKFLLVKKLAILKEVIENYQFQGSDGIKREIENIYGSIICNVDKIKNEEEKKIVKIVLDQLGKIIIIASAAKNLLPEGLTEIFQNFLPPG